MNFAKIIPLEKEHFLYIFRIWRVEEMQRYKYGLDIFSVEVLSGWW